MYTYIIILYNNVANVHVHTNVHVYMYMYMHTCSNPYYCIEVMNMINSYFYLTLYVFN